MMDDWVEHAPAKVNLILRVGPRRSDGYHSVATVIQPLDLHDTVRIWVERGRAGRPETHEALDVEVTSDHPSVPSGSGNLVWQAVHALKPALIKAGVALRSVRVHITKRIPIAAGLAGGSADAAAVLRGLNRGLDLGLSQSEMGSLGARLGSDVPACVVGASVFCFGRGERVTPLEAERFWWVLANPGGGLSASEVYAAFDHPVKGDRSQRRPSAASWETGSWEAVPPELAVALRQGNAVDLAPLLHNDLEEAARRLHSGIRPLLTTMSQGGSLRSLVSGSGPTLFGLVPDKRAARTIAYNVQQVAPWVWWGPSAAPLGE